jgi:hypothetical protein
MNPWAENHGRSQDSEMTNQNITRYVRYTDASGTHCGILEGETIRQLGGYFLDDAQPNGIIARLADVTLEVPARPRSPASPSGITGPTPSHA